MPIKIISLLIVISFTLIGCAFMGHGKNCKDKGCQVKKLPLVRRYSIPGGNTENWHYLGVSKDSAISSEIDESSISTNIPTKFNESIPATSIISFRDRKSIFKPLKVDVESSLNYHYSLAWWQINCTSKKYTLTSLELYDQIGNLIYKLTNPKNVNTWYKISNGSLGELQYNYICLKVDRNLGY